MANYTALSEKLDAEEVHQVMDGCFKILMDEIHRHEGTINQSTGDGVMALFGAPLDLPGISSKEWIPRAAREHWELAATQWETSDLTHELERTCSLIDNLPS